MLVQWMAYATFVAALVACGALAADYAAAIWGAARRTVWIVATVVAVCAPLVFALRRAPAAPPTTPAMLGGGTSSAMSVSIQPVAVAPAENARLADRVTSVRVDDRYAMAAWVLASAIVFLIIARAMILLQLQRRGWREESVDGHSVLVANDVGPAVVGAFRPRIVIPEWALALDDTERTLMLRHEMEHLRSGDPAVFLCAMAAIIAFPWNAALWLIVRRLRLAVEMDCDRRVLRTADYPREYGLLLITVGARQHTSFQLVASLAERRPLLERRIRAMTMIRPAYPRIATAALVVCAVGATTAATRTPRPSPLRLAAPALAARDSTLVKPVTNATQPTMTVKPDSPAAPRLKTVSPEPIARRTPTRAPMATSDAPTAVLKPRVVTPGGLTLDEIRALVRQFYPSVFNGDESIAAITFVVDSNHRYLMSQTSATAPEAAVMRRVPEGGGRGGRGGVADLQRGAPQTPEDSAKMEDAMKLLAAMKERLETLKASGYTGDTLFNLVRGRGGDPDKAQLDSTLVLAKLAQVKAREREGDPEPGVKPLLGMLHDSGVRWNAIMTNQMRYAAGTIGPREITIVTVVLDPQ